MTTWNYRITRRVLDAGDVLREVEYAIREVYYSDEGAVEGWTEDAIPPVGDTPLGVMEALARMDGAWRLGVLDLETRKTLTSREAVALDKELEPL